MRPDGVVLGLLMTTPPWGPADHTWGGRQGWRVVAALACLLAAVGMWSVGNRGGRDAHDDRPG
jgi:hypothetical protein